MTNSEKGTLFIVSTPIGNMKDISERAFDCLKSADLVACEDTRHTGLLLSRLGFKKKLISYNDLNARKRISQILTMLKLGSDVAIVSDAGTPGVSDPAYRIVRAAAEDGFSIYSVPGPSAVLAALVVSGLPLDRFVFEGFIPHKGARRKKRLMDLADEPRTIVLFESPHRIMNLLETILDVMGDREISVSREMTKIHEETRRGRVSEIIKVLTKTRPRGEYTVVIRGKGKKKTHEKLIDNI